jgi:putative endonuclease
MIRQRPRLGGLLARLRAALGLARPSARDPLGPLGERIALRHLKAKGYRLLGRNLRVPMGEADLLLTAPDRKTIVLVEVKTRSVRPGERPFAAPEAAVHKAKRRKLASIMRHLARANRWHDRPLRIDVVAIEHDGSDTPVIRHWENAVALRPSGRR